MKTSIRKSVLVALMLGTFSSYATGTTLKENHDNDEKVAAINVKKGERLSIKNSKGKVVFQKQMENNTNFSKEFDFTSLKNGYYTLERNKDFLIEITPFTIVSGDITFHEKAEKTIFKPVVRTKNYSILLSKIDFDNTPLQVIIYFENEVILKDVVKGEQLLSRVYTLRKDIKGDYKVVMKANDRTYTNEFSL